MNERLKPLALLMVCILAASGCAYFCEHFPDSSFCQTTTTTTTTSTTTTTQHEEPMRLRVMWLRDSGAAWREYEREMNLSGEAISFEDYKSEIAYLRNSGMNGHIVFTYNLRDGTGFGGKTDIYKRGFASEVDEAKLAALLEKLDYAARYLTLVLCPIPDDGGFNYDDMAAVKRHYGIFVERIVNRYADNPRLAPHGVKIMLALEPEEYWNQGQLNDIGKYLDALTDVEINVHGTKGHYQWAEQASWCDVINLQLDWRKDDNAVVRDAAHVMGATTKPIYCWEVTRGGADNSHRLGVRAGLEALDPKAKRIKGTP